MILYTLYKNSYIDIAHLESTKGITCYVNSTNRCTCSCTFCLRQTKEMIENNSLWLKEEPTVDEIIQEFEKYNLNDFKEVVFCGFGEPLIRHDDLMKVAKYLKERRPDLPTRVNTNGLSSLYNKRDITPEFKGLLDTVSISLNTSNKEDYLKLTRSQYGIDSFDELLDEPLPVLLIFPYPATLYSIVADSNTASIFLFIKISPFFILKNLYNYL